LRAEGEHSKGQTMSNGTNINHVEGGYVLQPRTLFDHALWTDKPLLYRCLWSYLCAMANHQDDPDTGLKRGQLRTSIPELIEVLSYKQGYRTHKPRKDHVFRALEWFRGDGSTVGRRWGDGGEMITTMKTTRGIIITICNYARYQEPANYERNSERNNNATTTQRHRDTIYKNGENVKKEKKTEETRKRVVFVKPSVEEIKEYCKSRGNTIDAEYFFNSYESKGWMIGNTKMKNWKSTICTWECRDKDRKAQQHSQPSLPTQTLEQRYTPTQNAEA